MKRVLVTGAHGFLGRHTAFHFKEYGYEVIGIGHGSWKNDNPEDFGIDQWIEADIDICSLSKIQKRIDCVVHCAGGSLVGPSLEHPLVEFHKTVTSAGNILEYIRLYQSGATLVFPSSAAVYGNKNDSPIYETESLHPVSPYGFYKKITEELCESYARNFDMPVAVIRFFSIYGNGLKKQLLWDACRKLSSTSKEVTFFGTGKETRDWLHIEDAVRLIYNLGQIHKGYAIYNGGSGHRQTNAQTINLLSELLGRKCQVRFNQEVRTGDPKHYWADIQKCRDLGLEPQKKIQNGLREYVDWFCKR